MSEMSGHIHHAIALRHLAAAQSLRGAVPEAGTLLPFGELTSAYTRVVDQWMAGTPSDAHDVLSLVNFVITAVGQQGRDAEGISPERWDCWVDEGTLPKPAPGFPASSPRWRWADVDRKLAGLTSPISDAEHVAATAGMLRGAPKRRRRVGRVG